MELIFSFLLLHYICSSLPSCSYESTVIESEESLSNYLLWFTFSRKRLGERFVCRICMGVHIRLTLMWGEIRKPDTVEEEVFPYHSVIGCGSCPGGDITLSKVVISSWGHVSKKDSAEGSLQPTFCATGGMSTSVLKEYLAGEHLISLPLPFPRNFVDVGPIPSLRPNCFLRPSIYRQGFSSVSFESSYKGLLRLVLGTLV